ncbi:fumarylacetoacetate hydrolase family protein [Sphingomonas naphthae]|uniref:Fumarylacetoacetate hydrolase family protein n=1 Tax=Sphingomonas naphthae TaxID=1813468 RepID=A0ABY7TP93_9SPHN|nr:fumarylacetoacetate hydrolase family protein [Sphingomonas naphthae]WCT74531.1 fumarylacetoacetate hydrolase family protein [Sphingomonas naphthae]
MRLATFSAKADGRPRLGIVTDAGVIALSELPDAPATMIDLIAEWPDWQAAVEALTYRAPTHQLEDVILHAPVPRPGKIMGIGLNYADHVAEATIEAPKEQLWFSKQATSVNDPYGALQLPEVSSALDYEGELVFVVGRRIRHATREEAKAAIFGFCCGNDVTVRDWQFKTSQFTLGKSFDTHAPFGPWIVTSDVLDPHALGIRTLVNGEQRQASNTRYLIYDCYDQIVHLSQAMTLEPGDVIFTGTPGGIGSAMRPQRWLAAGDVVRVEIDGIGMIENVVRPE